MNCHCIFSSYAQKVNGHLPGCGIINEEAPCQQETTMRAQYDYGRGLTVFVPPTESEVAIAIVQIIIDCAIERGLDTEKFSDLIICIEQDRRARQ